MKSWLRGPRAFALAGVLAILIAGALVAASLAGRSTSRRHRNPRPRWTRPRRRGSSREFRRTARCSAVRTPRSRSSSTATSSVPTAPPGRTRRSRARRRVRPAREAADRVPGNGLHRAGVGDGARAALAAGEQDKLWHVVDLLYHNQGHENSGWLNDETLRLVGSSVPGLDVERMLDRREAMSAALEESEALRGRGRHHRHAVLPGRADGRAADARPDLVPRRRGAAAGDRQAAGPLSDRALRSVSARSRRPAPVTGTHLRALRRRLDHVHDRRLRDRAGVLVRTVAGIPVPSSACSGTPRSSRPRSS